MQRLKLIAIRLVSTTKKETIFLDPSFELKETETSKENKR